MSSDALKGSYQRTQQQVKSINLSLCQRMCNQMAYGKSANIDVPTRLQRKLIYHVQKIYSIKANTWCEMDK